MSFRTMNFLLTGISSKLCISYSIRPLAKIELWGIEMRFVSPNHGAFAPPAQEPAPKHQNPYLAIPAGRQAIRAHPTQGLKQKEEQHQIKR
jgi:hypothetical protein